MAKTQAQVILIIGGAWGDEGKGKLSAYYGQNANLVIRATGGANAGHTIFVGGQKKAVHLIPSGIIYPQAMGLIGQGVALDPEILLDEIKDLEAAIPNIKKRLKISGTATILMPYHKTLDRIYESLKSKKIGTTGRGIGPAYEDKAKRVGLRAYDLLLPFNELKLKIMQALTSHRALLAEGVADQISNIEDYATNLALNLKEDAEVLAPMIVNGHQFVQSFLKNPDNLIVVEGAQAVRLSIETGDYPNCTSSDSNTLGTLSGAHLNHKDVTEVINVFKAYSSRVGNGPFPTELDSHIGPDGKLMEYVQEEAYEGDLMRDFHGEYGASTGRPRRVGPFDAAIAKLSAEVSGADYLCINCLDSIGAWGNKIGHVQLSYAYSYGGKEISYFPDNIELTYELPTPKYITINGGWEITPEMKTFESLPQIAKLFITMIEELVGKPIKYIGVGPKNEDIIVRDDV